MLQDPGVASFVEFAFYKNEGLGAACKPSAFRLIRWQRVMEKIVEVECSPVVRRVRHCAFFKLHDLGVGRSRWLVSPRGRIRWAVVGPPRPFVAYRGFVLVAGKNSRGDRLSDRCRFRKRVGCLVEASRDVIEFQAVELIL